MKITTTATPSTIGLRGKTTIRAVVGNVGRYPANTVEICLTIPTNLTFVKASGSGRRCGSKVCWTRAQIAGGKSTTVSYTARGRKATTRALTGTADGGNTAKVTDRTRVKVRSVSPNYTG